MARILIADDNESTLDELKKALADHDLAAAPGGEQALAMTKDEKFDLVITGQLIPKIGEEPKIGGIRILWELRRRDDDTPIVIISPDVVGYAAAGYEEVGFAAALPERFTKLMAIEAVEQALNGKAQ